MMKAKHLKARDNTPHKYGLSATKKRAVKTPMDLRMAAYITNLHFTRHRLKGLPVRWIDAGEASYRISPAYKASENASEKRNWSPQALLSARRAQWA